MVLHLMCDNGSQLIMLDIASCFEHFSIDHRSKQFSIDHHSVRR